MRAFVCGTVSGAADSLERREGAVTVAGHDADVRGFKDFERDEQVRFSVAIEVRDLDCPEEVRKPEDRRRVSGRRLERAITVAQEDLNVVRAESYQIGLS